MTTDVIERCYLYRFFDASERLLYVGIARDLGARFSAHRRDAAWWSRVAFGTTETHPSRADAELAEALAIVSEHPEFNVSRPSEGKIGGLVDAASSTPNVTELVAEIERLRKLCGEQSVTIVRLRGHVEAARASYRRMRAAKLQADTDRSLWSRKYFELANPSRLTAGEPLPQTPPTDWAESLDWLRS